MWFFFLLLDLAHFLVKLLQRLFFFFFSQSHTYTSTIDGVIIINCSNDSCFTSHYLIDIDNDIFILLLLLLIIIATTLGKREETEAAT